MKNGSPLTIVNTQDGVAVRTASKEVLNYRRLQLAHRCPDRAPLTPGTVVTVRKITEDGSILVRGSCGCEHLLYEPVHPPAFTLDGHGASHGPASGHRCPACRGTSVGQSHRRGWLERFILPMVGYRPYHCLGCGVRFLDRRSRFLTETAARTSGDD